jgi:hypothetical protein
MAKSGKVIKIKERALIEWVILAFLLLLILYLALAPGYHWWPYQRDTNLGTAFYSGIESTDSTGGSSTTNNTTTGSGSNGGSGGGSTPSGSGSSALLTFSAGVNSGDTKEEVSGSAGGLNESCALLVQSSTAGKQEVCTYTEGDKVVTVTFLNDNVVSASRSGF